MKKINFILEFKQNLVNFVIEMQYRKFTKR